MKKLKRSLSLFLCLLLLLSLLPVSALAAEPEAAAEPAPQTEAEEAAQGDMEGTEPAAEEPALAALPSDRESGNEEEPGTEPEDEPEGETEDEPEEEPENEPEEEPENEPEDEPEEEPEEEPELAVEQAVELYAPGAEEGDAALLEQYAQKRLDSLSAVRNRKMLRGARDPADTLEGVNRTVYNILKQKIALIASGESEDMLTVFSIPVEDLGLLQSSWTADELGFETLLNAEGNNFTSEAMAAVNERVGFNLRIVLNCLQSACPYELYWYDKTMGTALQSYSFAGNSKTIRLKGTMTFTFSVSRDYADSRTRTIDGVDYPCGVDRQYGERVSNAVANAAAIIQDFAGYSAYEKLLGYKNRICALVEYDDLASVNHDRYGDPWQIISVFDGDTETNVVCEGYAKAFQYLCDKSELGGVMAWCASGMMQGGTGAGSHMWNLVRMDDGLVYLVDVTNCDEGSIGYADGLFLVGGSSGSVASGYVCMVKGRQIHYAYDEKSRALYSEEELTLATSNYITVTPRVPGVVETVDELLEDIGNGVTDIRFYGAGSFLVNKALSIPAGVKFTLGEGTLLVSSGVSMSVASGATVTAYKAQIAGGVSNSGTLRLLSASAPLEVTGSLRCESGGGVYVRDLGFQRTGKMRTGGGYYYVEQEPDNETALRSACAAAAASGDSALLFRILPRAAISLSADLTLPRCSRVIVEAPYCLVPDAGVTLTNSGKLTVYQSFTAAGRVMNENVLTLAKNVVADFAGGYAGGGTLRVSKEASDPFAQVASPAASVFSAERAADGYWELTLKSFTLRYDANSGSGSFTEQTARYGSVLSVTDAVPMKNGYRFLGWASSPDAAEAAWQPGANLTLTGELTLYAVWAEDTVSFVYADSVTFKGELKLNFYLKLSDTLAQDANAYVLIRFNGMDKKLLVKDARRSTVNGVSCHIFALPVVAKLMREEATLRLYQSDGTLAALYLKEADVSEAGYVSSVMAYLVKTQSTSTNPKMVALAKAAENYGTAAQIYFAGQNNDHSADGLTVAPEVTAVTEAQLAAFKPVYYTEKTSGITLHSASVMFKSDNALRQYFTFKDGEKIGSYGFTIDGQSASPVYSSTNRYYVALPNIAAKDLDTAHAYVVNCGGQSYSFRFSALSYAYQILQNSTNADMINLAKALYLYNLAANEYFA